MTSLRGLWVLGVWLAMMAGWQERLRAEPPKGEPNRVEPRALKPPIAVVAAPEPKTEASPAVPFDQKTAPIADQKNVPVGRSPSEQKVDPEATPPAWPSADQLSSALLRGPSMYETGRVGKMGVAEAGLQIRQTHNRSELEEQRAEARTAHAAGPPTVDSGMFDPVLMRREIKPKFALLRDCRTEAARGKKIGPNALPASELTLRWTILDDGRVTDTQVVATARVDSRIMSCVKRQMSQWSFSSPSDGPVRVESPFKF
jgi:hypothetical protein